MAADMQPATDARADSPSKDDLISKLDGLLEHYLNTLDAYQKAQAQLREHLSSGYFSLAQANFNNARGRFGRDHYDERMQASRTVTLNTQEEKTTFAVDSVFATDSRTAANASEKMSGSKEHANKAETADKAANADKANTAEDADKALDADKAENADKAKNANSPSSRKTGEGETTLVDPIRWFGILVPPALRSAQASFVASVKGPIPQLSTLASELRGTEVDIGRLRKQIKKL